MNEVLPSQAAPVPVSPVRLDLAPGAADHVLAHGAFEQSAERALHPPRVGAGKVARGNQGFCLPGHPPVARQDGTAPFPRPTFGPCHPSPRHRDLERSERTQEPAPPHAVPIAVRRSAIAPIARAPESRRQLFLEHPLNEPAHPLPHARLDRIKPRRAIKQAASRRRCAILLHGVISLGAPTPSWWLNSPGDYAPQISTHSRRDHLCRQSPTGWCSPTVLDAVVRATTKRRSVPLSGARESRRHQPVGPKDCGRPDHLGT